MTQIVAKKQEEWLKVLGKGMVTLPKKWRDEMGIENGDVVKAKKNGNTVTIEIEAQSSTQNKTHLAKGITPEFVASVDEFIKAYRPALEELAHK